MYALMLRLRQPKYVANRWRSLISVTGGFAIRIPEEERALAPTL